MEGWGVAKPAGGAGEDAVPGLVDEAGGGEEGVMFAEGVESVSGLGVQAWRFFALGG